MIVILRKDGTRVTLPKSRTIDIRDNKVKIYAPSGLLETEIDIKDISVIREE